MGCRGLRSTKKNLTKEDLEKTATYLQKYENSPVILREAVWYVIAVHFVIRGIKSLDFKGDSDSQYIVLNQEIKQKNHQGGSSSTNPMSEKSSMQQVNVCVQ
ncbi:hypothetical protein DPMN_148990 [Dreissena polymorpha]|uniref:Uncharacterized protein n=1 Tax=Dreissena polymorpha TaxID=45954 RepID=A0A9D4J223_DREPO|nr:hypothetical protein DPMN_148990 [Dreissena polymorpha]